MSYAALSQNQVPEDLPMDVSFTEVRSGEVVTLGKEHLAELESNQGLLDAQSVRILIVSYGSLEGARYWLQDTGCKYDMVLDSERKVYRTFGMGSSYTKVLKFKNILRYAEFPVSNKPIPRADPRLVEDMYQLGGNFILDDTGRVIYSHRCSSPLDRPPTTQILAAVGQGGFRSAS
ncbi:hypothetical protein GN956_G7075 [Arapaima gigas]